MPTNTSRRANCPCCGGTNTFSVTNEGGRIKAHCFKASCEVGVGTKGDVSIADIREALATSKSKKLIRFDTLHMPEFAGIGRSHNGMEWLKKSNCMDALVRFPNRFKYDIKRDRVVFISLDGPYIDFATGRAVSGARPKWYKYFGLNGLFCINLFLSENMFIVEDCASACSIARLGAAIALGGTAYDIGQLAHKIKTYGPLKTVRVCLDGDAQRKSMQLAKDLEGLLPSAIKVKVVNLSDDAKYLSYDKLRKELGL